MVAAAARPAGGIAGAALGKPPALVARPLFPLFYLVEIRHRQLHSTISHPLRGARCRKSTMPLWQLRGCRYRKFRTAGVKRAMTGRAMLRVITFPLEAY